MCNKIPCNRSKWVWLMLISDAVRDVRNLRTYVRLTCVKMSDNSDDDLCAVAAAACTIVIGLAVECSRVGSKRKRRRTWVRSLLYADELSWCL